MRRKVIAGNWKMNNDLNGSEKLIRGILQGLKGVELNCDVIICPPYTSLSEAAKLISGSTLILAAQNMYFEPEGAYTGEISASMLKSTGCSAAIIGHSERRSIFGENNELINKKLKAAFKNGITPIFCIGETLYEREHDIMEQVIARQLTEGLQDISAEDLRKIIIAYEPVWAIGTGKTATPRQAQEVHAYIRTIIEKLYSGEISKNLTILYGGSVKADNAETLLSQSDIDGALVGGACLKADSFIDIIRAVK